ncbi:MAG: anthranilate synthase component I family protein [Cyanobacteria bacterium K_DeepCast_35m_m2_023]|nr:anthranilate synthase component I family protein [Cyanobacteria bacterium K_DeepCast_35m_m2_023]
MTRQPNREPLPWLDPWPLLLAIARDYGDQGLVWLEGDGSALGRQSRLGFAPQHSICCRGLPQTAGARDPFAALAAMEQQLAAQGGSWMGWLAYEAGAWVEPASHWRPPGMALLWAAHFEAELVFDLVERRLWLEHWGDGAHPLGPALLQLIAQVRQSPPTARAGPPLAIERWNWHSDRNAFAAQVKQIKAWIAAGDLFQANLTACCEVTLSADECPGRTGELALDLYGRLRQHCPAPFAGLAIGSGDAAAEALLCSSPERFLRRDRHGLVETRPIKGTRPRHAEGERDALSAAELISSPKDRAENVMIVDLLRNDLGRVCTTGSIQVPQLVGLESYRQVHHLTSVVQGQLRQGLGIADLLRACWPGGSISGAPKIRACERLNQLEPIPRGPYCGSLFRLAADGSFDSNIVIRSLMLNGHTLRAHAGCGIVADSDPTAEADEMGWKSQPLLEALAR